MAIINYKTKVSKNTPNSFRTTIPKEIIELLKFQVGNSINWEVEINPQNEIKVSIKKSND